MGIIRNLISEIRGEPQVPTGMPRVPLPISETLPPIVTPAPIAADFTRPGVDSGPVGGAPIESIASIPAPSVRDLPSVNIPIVDDIPTKAPGGFPVPPVMGGPVPGDLDFPVLTDDQRIVTGGDPTFDVRGEDSPFVTDLTDIGTEPDPAVSAGVTEPPVSMVDRGVPTPIGSAIGDLPVDTGMQDAALLDQGPVLTTTETASFPTTPNTVDPVITKQKLEEVVTDPLIRALYFGTAEQPGFFNQLQQAGANIIGAESLPTQYDQSMTQQFMNPFEQAVVQQTIEDVIKAGEQRDIAQRAQDIGRGGLSAFGSRARLSAAERQRALGRGLAESLASIRQSGFSEAQRTGLSEFDRQRQRQLEDIFRPLTVLTQIGQQLPGYTPATSQLETDYGLPTDPTAAGLSAAASAYSTLIGGDTNIGKLADIYNQGND
tara:strand:+ start:712 stop:2007 length:1296 start_codon:yes stop_codon:yes gene_type:complete